MNRLGQTVRENSFLVEMMSTVFVIFGELMFLMTALIQSGGNVFYKVRNKVIEDGITHNYYHTEHMDITEYLLAYYLCVTLILLIAAFISWKKELYLMRVVTPISVLVFCGVMCQAFLAPNALENHLMLLFMGVFVYIFSIFLIQIEISEWMFQRICIAAIAAAVICTVYGIFFTKGGNGSWFLGVQPGEFFKILELGLCCVGFEYLRKPSKLDVYKFRFDSRTLYFCVCLAFLISVLMVKDIGNAMILAIIFMIILISLTQYKKVLAATVSGITMCMIGLLLSSRSRFFHERISQSLFYPVSHFEEKGSVNQNLRGAILALQRGGMRGTGVERSNALFASDVYASRTDFTFACGVSIFGLLFGLLMIYCLWRLTKNVTITMRQAGVSGNTVYQSNIIVCFFLIQVIVHVLGSLSLIPFTGVVFPLISTGGSSIAASFFTVGALTGLYLPGVAQDAIKKTLNDHSGLVRIMIAVVFAAGVVFLALKKFLF